MEKSLEQTEIWYWLKERANWILSLIVWNYWLEFVLWRLFAIEHTELLWFIHQVWWRNNFFKAIFCDEISEDIVKIFKQIMWQEWFKTNLIRFLNNIDKDNWEAIDLLYKLRYITNNWNELDADLLIEFLTSFIDWKRKISLIDIQRSMNAKAIKDALTWEQLCVMAECNWYYLVEWVNKIELVDKNWKKFNLNDVFGGIEIKVINHLIMENDIIVTCMSNQNKQIKMFFYSVKNNCKLFKDYQFIMHVDPNIIEWGSSDNLKYIWFNWVDSSVKVELFSMSELKLLKSLTLKAVNLRDRRFPRVFKRADWKVGLCWKEYWTWKEKSIDIETLRLFSFGSWWKEITDQFFKFT